MIAGPLVIERVGEDDITNPIVIIRQFKLSQQKVQYLSMADQVNFKHLKSCDIIDYSEL